MVTRYVRTLIKSLGTAPSRFLLVLLVALLVCGLAGANVPSGTAAAGPPLQASLPPAGYASDQLLLKFREGADLRSFEAILNEAQRASIQSMIPLFTLPPDKLDALRTTGEQQSGQKLPDLSLWYKITLSPGSEAASLFESLRSSPDVEFVQYDLLPAPPPATTPNFTADQGYLNAAPGGIDARHAWSIPGGNGTGITIYDVEYDWLQTHEDLSRAAGVALLLAPGDTNDSPYPNDHGTAVLGELIANNDDIGVTGISWGANIGLAPANTTNLRYNPANAIILATANGRAGDVILIEQQASVCGLADYGPLEGANAAVYDAIQIATGNGFVVVEAAGNGGVNLDQAACGDTFNRAVRDSGAIIVGAGLPPATGHDREREGFSSFGSRVDLQGWGSGVRTTGYGDFYVDPDEPDNANRWYTTFGGTSSASPIVAGAVANLQGIARSRFGTALSPWLVRSILARTGSAQQGTTAQNIGPRPNLEAAIGQGIVIRNGFDSQTLPGNDDGSTGLVPIGFPVNFFGNTFEQLYVNNNGNVTFDFALSTFTPFNLNSTNRIIVAPFFADVDTRVGRVVTYGQGSVGGRPAFGVTWPGVGCYNQITSVLNIFQLVLIDRSDIGPGDFDIEFNHSKIQWETGTASGGNSSCQGGSPARVGYANGSGVSFELPGSGVAGAFLDNNLTTGLVHNSRNSLQPGRYMFEVRNSTPPTGGTISGFVFVSGSSTPVADALVQVCRTTGGCNTTRANSSGQYSVSGLEGGEYEITAFPPSNRNLQPGRIGPLTLAPNGVIVDANVPLSGPLTPPTGTTITNVGTGPNGVPIVNWRGDLTLTTLGCPQGTASYIMTQSGSIIRSGAMTEGPPGTYTAIIPELYPLHGYARIEITITCPDGSTTSIAFDIYIDPSGHVRTVDGAPIAGATVTLFRSDSSGGPFEQVPDGSPIMAPENRNNPDITDAEGRFGWNVLAGYYVVRAQAPGCVSPIDPTVTYVESPILTIPPPVTDLDLRLLCGTNMLPVADAAGPYATGEAQAVLLDASASYDPDGEIVLYEWDLDNDGQYDDASGVSPSVVFGDDGVYVVGLRVTDNLGSSATDTTEVNVLNVPPVVDATPAAQTVQYSDTIVEVVVLASDVLDDSLLVATEWSFDGGAFSPGLPGSLTLTANGCSSNGGNACSWTLSGPIAVLTGPYTIRANVADEDGGQSSADIFLGVEAEAATVTFANTNPTTVQVEQPGGYSGPVSLVVAIEEMEPDAPAEHAAPGNIGLASVTMTLAPVGPGGTITGSCVPGNVIGSGYEASLPVTCSFSGIPTNIYVIRVSIGGGHYVGSGEDLLVVSDPSLGFTTGGGWFFWPGTEDRTTFGFTMSHKPNGGNVRGNLVLVRHQPDGSIYRVKSNALYGLSLGQAGNPPFGWASFSGKATYLEPGWIEPRGNYQFLVYVEDRDGFGDEPDRFWIEVRDQQGAPIAPLTMDQPAPNFAVGLEGGNIVVPHRR